MSVEVVVIARRGGKWYLLPLDPGNVSLEVHAEGTLEGMVRTLELRGHVLESAAAAWEAGRASPELEARMIQGAAYGAMVKTLGPKLLPPG